MHVKHNKGSTRSSPFYGEFCRNTTMGLSTYSICHVCPVNLETSAHKTILVKINAFPCPNIDAPEDLSVDTVKKK